MLRFVAFFAAALVVVSPILGAGLYETNKIELNNEGRVSCAPFGKVVFQDSFEQPGLWSSKISNFENRLSINVGKQYQDSSCLYITSETALQTDTAWSVRSNPLPLTDETGRTGKESRFALSFRIASNVKIHGDLNDGKTWQNRIEWLDKDGNAISEQQFVYLTPSTDFTEYIIYGAIPAQAQQFILQFGFDRPNIGEGQFFALRSVSLSVLDAAGSFAPSASFCSEIISDGGPISWSADVPEGTDVKFQIAAAETLDKIKTAPFVGPEGTPESYFSKPFVKTAPFLRYKAFLFSNGEKTPILQSVSVGNRRDSNWASRLDDQPPRVKIVSQTPTTNTRTPVVLEITDSAPLVWSELKITVDGQDATSHFKRGDNRLTNDEKSNPAVAPWSEGLHTVDVEIADFYGNRVEAKKCFFIGSAPKTPQITMRDDGLTLIDGKPFFPIGIYGVMKRSFNDFNFDKAFADLKEAGFNFAHSYSSPRTDEFLAAALKYDFKLWTVARFPDERFINVERHCPAIIAWYLGDDTSANTTPSELFDRNDAVKAVDPTRITTQADGVHADAAVSNYQDYVLGTDNFLPEIYPVRTTQPDSARDCVAITIADMKRVQEDIRRSGGAPRSIWPIIQYFQGWGWQRFPTFDELNAMSFAAIIHGAHGITWYTYGGTVEPEKKKFNYGITTSPERWKNISTVATRIRDLSPVLIERTGEQPMPPQILDGPKRDSKGNDSISFLLKRSGPFAYLFVVNSTQEPVTALFTIPDVELSAEVLYENRVAALKEAQLTESFPGFAVRIYKLKSTSKE